MEERFSGDVFEFLHLELDSTEMFSILSQVERIRPHLGPLSADLVNDLYSKLVDPISELIDCDPNRNALVAWFSDTRSEEILCHFGEYGMPAGNRVIEIIEPTGAARVAL